MVNNLAYFVLNVNFIFIPVNILSIFSIRYILPHQSPGLSPHLFYNLIRSNNLNSLSKQEHPSQKLSAHMHIYPEMLDHLCFCIISDQVIFWHNDTYHFRDIIAIFHAFPILSCSSFIPRCFI